MYSKRIQIVCLLLFLVLFGIDAQDNIIKVHFLHGSKPKKEFIKSEKRWFGGIKGGHVGIEIDNNRVISFLPEGRFHIFPRRKKHSIFKIQSVDDFYNEITGSPDPVKKTIVEIPLSTHGKRLLDSISQAYITKAPYDYAFFGMRCSSACYDILGKIGILRPFSLTTLWLRIFYPKILRRKILELAELNNWIVERYTGTTKRIWEKDQDMKKVKVGSRVPRFTLADQNGKSFPIDSVIGKKNLVIYFYPKDDSPGCTREACYFRDQFETFTQADALIIGISGQSVVSHKKFAEKYHLSFTLLSDEGNKVRKLFGVPVNFFGLLPGRVTYVVDKTGKVVYIFNSQSDPDRHVDEALAVLKRLP